MYLSTIKYNVVDMCQNTTATHAATGAVSTILYLIAKLAKNGFATNIANMFQATIGSMFVNHNNSAAHQSAQHKVVLANKLNRSLQDTV
jgi:hypothetical protein